jgi:replicative DNA helicase
MTIDPNTSHADRARTAIRSVLSGAAPNGTRPENCGPYAEAVAGVFAGWAAKGTEGARTVWASQTKQTPALIKLVSTEPTEAERTWGGVLPFHKADLPDFPLDIYPTWLREYCEAVTETMQTPPDLAGMLALAVISTACAGHIEVTPKPGWTEPVNVFTVVGLPPGTGKSPVFRAMTGPIIRFEIKQLEKSEKDIMDSEMRRDVLETRIRDMKNKAGKVQGDAALKKAYAEIDDLNEELRGLEVPVRPKYIVDDATPESVASILAEQGGRLAVLSAEGDIFSIMAGRYSSGAPNIGVYKKGHAGDELRVDRRNRSEVVRRPALTMGITTQPEVMQSFGQNDVFRSEGLLARFFYALPKNTIGTREVNPDPIPDHVRDTYHYRMLNILENLNCRDSRNSRNEETESSHSRKNIYIDNSNNIIYIKISIEGSILFFDFKAWVEPRLGEYGEFSALTDWANKLPGAVLRIAGLLHMSEHASYNSYNSCDDEISADTIRRAIRFAHYLIPHAQAAYAEIGADPAVSGARRVLRWIEKTGSRTFEKQACYQGVKGTLKRADDLDPVLSLLCDHGYLREIEAPPRVGPGRKAAPSYEVNPIVFDGNPGSHNSQNTSASYTPVETAAYEPPTFRAMEGY